MKLTNVVLSGAVLGLAQATPVAKRAINDADILNYALTLEHLEATFYEEGLKNYTKEDFMNAGYKDPFYANLQQVAMDEKDHEQFLTKGLMAAGAHPVERCTYAFPATDVNSFLTVASILEGVGVSAYLGAAAHIMNDTYLTEAGSILTVEARHSSYLRAQLKEVPFAQPFDNPLDFNEVYTVASPFIASCPSSNQKLPVKAFPSLTPSSMKPAMCGSDVELMTGEGFNSMKSSDVQAAFITVTGPVWAKLKDNGGGKYTVTVPKGVAGQSYVVLTNGNAKATDDNILAGPAVIEVVANTGSMSSMSSMSSSTMPSSTMPSSSMTPGSMASGSMASGSMASGSMASGSASPMYTGAAGSMPRNMAGMFCASVMAVAVAVQM